MGTSGWFVESLTVCGSGGSASHGYVSYSEFRVGSRDASRGAAIAAEDVMVEQCSYSVRAGVQDAAVSLGIKVARWTSCWDSLWSASEGAEYQKEFGCGNQWLVR